MTESLDSRSGARFAASHRLACDFALSPTVHWKAFMGGAQYQIKQLLDHLRALDRYDIHYLARRVPEDTELDGYRIHRIGDRESTPRFGYTMDAPQLYRLLQRLRPHVIYQRIGCAYTGIATYYARRSGARIVWHASSDADMDRTVRPAERNFLRNWLRPRCSIMASGTPTEL